MKHILDVTDIPIIELEIFCCLNNLEIDIERDKVFIEMLEVKKNARN